MPKEKTVFLNPGDRYNRWTVQFEVESYRTPGGTIKRRFQCICDCGNIGIVRMGELRSNVSKSCKCQKKDSTIKRNTKHGFAVRLDRPTEYNIWKNMKKRCKNPKTKAYKDYGGRGIKVAQEWDKSFVAFYNHVGPRPSKAHSLDRIDNNGNYEPGNVRWATADQQANNKRNSKKNKCQI